MKKTFNYNPDLTGFNIVKTDKGQFDAFFYSGHPNFLIPDFYKDPCDIWLSFMEYLEAQIGDELYDQDGGAIESQKVIDSVTGLTTCTYVAYGIIEEEDGDSKDYDVEITGYVVEDTNGSFLFLATKVEITEKVNI